MYSLPDGPVLSTTYDLIRRPGTYWGRFISGREGYDIRALDDPGSADLSDFERDTLNGIFVEFGKFSYKEMWDYSHTRLPEHRDPQGSSVPIDPDSILRSAGYTEDEIRQAHSVAASAFIIENPETLPPHV